MESCPDRLILTALRLSAFGLCSIALCAHAQSADEGAGSDAELAKKLSNPVAAMISFPLQSNYDNDIGPARDGEKFTLNVQPVVPVPVGENWVMISRTILPIASQDDIVPGSGHQTGTGDITQSLFFSPKQPGSNGIIWGIGPAFLIPTASDDLLGSKKWGLGPTAVVLKQSHGWTYGFLANQIWSVASMGDVGKERGPVSSTFFQPFVSYTTPTAWTYGANIESTYDWHAHDGTIPLNLSISKLTRLGNTPVSISGGVRYWLDSTDTGPHGWGFRFAITMLFPT